MASDLLPQVNIDFFEYILTLVMSISGQTATAISEDKNRQFPNCLFIFLVYCIESNLLILDQKKKDFWLHNEHSS